MSNFTKSLISAANRCLNLGWSLTKQVIGFVWREFWGNLGIIVGYACVGVIGIALTVLMLVPAYKDPSSRMYTSGMGYGAMKRKMGLPFEVSGARVVRKEVEIPYLGEGLVTGAPVRLAMIPMAIVKKIHVQEGDYVQRHQVLLELDDTEAQRKLASARLALRTAQAELHRVEVGSTYVLAQERPEYDQIRLKQCEEDVRLLTERLVAERGMLQRGLIAKTTVVESERELSEAKSLLEECRFFARMSDQGVGYSQEIARNAVADAQALVGFREKELDNYQVVSPCDGIVSAVLIREGEFNSDMGKPAFLLTSGLWFEGYFDQAVLSRLKVGQPAEVFLEAFPGQKFEATVSKIISEVSFASGGPEIGRPMRPRGTGAPEWAATFRVRFAFQEQTQPLPDASLAIGMTGNVRVATTCDAYVIPRNGVLSVAANRGLVTVPATDTLEEVSEGWTQKPVKLGYVGHDWAEIAEGVDEGEVVLVKGHRIIREGDAIRLVEITD